MLDLMPSLAGWHPVASGQRCAVATVVGTSGSVPRPMGTSMMVSEAGDVLGSLSGGCVEGAVVEAALESMRDGGTRRWELSATAPRTRSPSDSPAAVSFRSTSSRSDAFAGPCSGQLLRRLPGTPWH